MLGTTDAADKRRTPAIAAFDWGSVCDAAQILT
jgi:hypothetical protein